MLSLPDGSPSGERARQPWSPSGPGMDCGTRGRTVVTGVTLSPVLYMVIERFLQGPGPVYARAAERGRMLPDGLRYVDSWIVDDDALDRCFQLMETDDPALFDVWAEQWSDIGSFEVLPVIGSAEAAARVGERFGR